MRDNIDILSVSCRPVIGLLTEIREEDPIANQILFHFIPFRYFPHFHPIYFHFILLLPRGLLHNTLPEKNSGYFNRSFVPMVKSMVKLSLPEFWYFTRGFSPVIVLCNRPHASLTKKAMATLYLLLSVSVVRHAERVSLRTNVSRGRVRSRLRARHPLLGIGVALAGEVITLGAIRGGIPTVIRPSAKRNEIRQHQIRKINFYINKHFIHW